MERDYTKIKVDPLFEPIKKLFEFFILGIGFIGMPTFQKAFLTVHPGIKPILDTYNKEVNLRFDGARFESSNKLYLVYIGRVMAISIFDFIQASHYNSKLGKTSIYRFAKHIRNGAAHNNRFNFTLSQINGKEAKWQNRVIDITLNGKCVIPDYINPNELLYLMEDLSKEIENYNKGIGKLRLESSCETNPGNIST